MNIYNKIKDTIKKLKDLEKNNNEKTDCKFREGYGCAIDEAIELVKKLVEPRFLLDEDSICYGCNFYKYYKEIDCLEGTFQDNLDENGGTCDSICPCFCGSLNNYKGD